MGLTPGTRVGAYQVLALIGSGGMGEVYRARDTRLDRDVALKVLPDLFVADAERIARFQREAKTLAALNHPNIAAIYGLEESNGTAALVLELVQGPTLADRIAEGPILLDDALPIARQIADALEAAHEQGIIHRDLKPANIKVRLDGTVKVLDFGLAKLAESSSTASDRGLAMSQSPTITTPVMMTGVGTILGTAAYMAPEQAKGRAADTRSDVWAFGCMLYEMLAGKRAFEGEDVNDTLANVLKSEPDWNELPLQTPATIRTLLRRCLTRDARRRPQHIGDVRLEIEDLLQGGRDTPQLAFMPTGAGTSRQRARTAALMAGSVIAGVLAAGGVYSFRGKPAADIAGAPVRLGYTLPDHVEIGQEFSPTLAISPNGRRIVFKGNLADGTRQLYLLDLANDFEARPIEGTRNARVPFFSPDGASIGFVDDVSLTLRRLSLQTGVSASICSVPQLLAGAAWGPDDTIVISSAGSGLSRVPASGGTLKPLTRLNTAARESAHFWPSFTPNGRFLIFSVLIGNRFRPARLSLQDGTYSLVEGIERGTVARYVDPGYLLWADGAGLFAAPFEAATSRLAAQPVKIREDVFSWAVSGLTYFAVSETGHFVYVPGGILQERRRLMLVDAAGRAVRLNAEEEYYVDPRFSPDGQRIAVTKGGTAGVGDIWVYEVATGRGQPITSSGVNGWPRWTSDGERITHQSGYTRVLSTPVRQDLKPEVLLETTAPVFPADWHPQKPLLLLERFSEQTGNDIYMLARGGQPEPVLATPSSEGYVDLSPDGAWLAYTSDESGRPEIYVKRFPGQERGIRISGGGGTEPRWSHDSKRLFFWEIGAAATPEGGRLARLMAVNVQFQPVFEAATARELFQGKFVSAANAASTLYDASPVADRFVMLEAVEQSGMRHMNIVLNWRQELKRLIPID